MRNSKVVSKGNAIRVEFDEGYITSLTVQSEIEDIVMLKEIFFSVLNSLKLIVNDDDCEEGVSYG